MLSNIRMLNIGATVEDDRAVITAVSGIPNNKVGIDRSVPQLDEKISIFNHIPPDAPTMSTAIINLVEIQNHFHDESQYWIQGRTETGLFLSDLSGSL